MKNDNNDYVVYNNKRNQFVKNKILIKNFLILSKVFCKQFIKILKQKQNISKIFYNQLKITKKNTIKKNNGNKSKKILDKKVFNWYLLKQKSVRQIFVQTDTNLINNVLKQIQRKSFSNKEKRYWKCWKRDCRIENMLKSNVDQNENCWKNNVTNDVFVEINKRL